MGDRCYLQVEIVGPINSVKDLCKLVEAISKEELAPTSGGGSDEKNVLFEFASTLDTDANFTAQFEDQDSNYGDVDALLGVCEELGIGYHMAHEAGMDYPGVAQSFDPKENVSFKFSCMKNHGPSIDIHTLERELYRCSGRDEQMNYINGLIKRMKIADGQTLPSALIVSDEVRAFFTGSNEDILARYEAAKALA